MTDLSFGAEVPVLDANVGVGHRHDRVHPCAQAVDLLAEMDRHGVGTALVYHVQGETISALDGNEALAAWTEAGQGRLLPQHVAGVHPDCLAQLQDLHAAAALCSVRLGDPGRSPRSLSGWVCDDLLDWLQGEGIPLWVSLADHEPADVAALLAGYPQLDCVLLGAHYVHTVWVRPLLRRLPRARLELSRFEELGGVESLVRDFGAERLLYGSFYPRYAMGPILFYLHRCDLTASQLQAICGRNARRLLKLPTGPADPAAPEATP